MRLYNSSFLLGSNSFIFILVQCIIVNAHENNAAVGANEASAITRIETKTDEEFDEIPISALVDLPTSPVDDRSKFDKNATFASDEFTEINLNEDENVRPSTANKNTQESPGPSGRRRLDVMKDRVQEETYYQTVYNPEDLEILLYYDETSVRPGGTNWWSVAGFKISQLYCSTFPLLKFSSLTAEISTHEFFKSNGIEIPRQRGKNETKKVEFRHLHRPQNPVEKTILECDCSVSSGGQKTLETINVCIDGRVVNLSRGVAGNQSFFVYAIDRSSGNLNVVAHIYFP